MENKEFSQAKSFLTRYPLETNKHTKDKTKERGEKDKHTKDRREGEREEDKQRTRNGDRQRERERCARGIDKDKERKSKKHMLIK